MHTSHSHAAPRCSERCNIYANRVQYSHAYLLTYALMILTNLCLLVWVVIEADYPLTHPARWAFLLADAFVTGRTPTLTLYLSLPLTLNITLTLTLT